MDYFHIIEEGVVILRGKRGLFKQAKVYRRGKDVFAGVSGGFIRLIGYGGTTNPEVKWLDIEAAGVTHMGNGCPKIDAPVEAQTHARAA